MEKQKHDLSLMSLHVGDIMFIFAYYSLLLISSLVFLIHQILISSNIENIGQLNSIFSLLSASTTGSTIFYSRKLYKASINSSYKFLSTNEISPSRIGTLFFFVLRPFFGVAFSIVVYALWRASVHASAGGSGTPKEFIFIVIPIGFFAGFSAGRLIEQFEDKPVNDLLRTSEEK